MISDEKLIDQLRALVESHGNDRYDVSDVLVDALSVLGFEQGKKDPERMVFYNRDRGLVFKLSYMIHPDRVPPRAIPTIVVYQTTHKKMVWVLQALAEYIIGGIYRLEDKFQRISYRIRSQMFG